MSYPDLLHRIARPSMAYLALAGLCISVLFAAGQSAWAETSKEEVALQMASLLRSARGVVSDYQLLLNEPNKGDKGFTGQFVLEEAKFNFRMDTGIDLNQIDPASLEGELLQAEMEAITEVVEDWQNRINRKGVGYKGFLPAVFAVQVTQRFKEKKGDKAEIKLTAPKDYVRNSYNLPDQWEYQIIEEQFRSPGYPYGRYVASMAQKDGQEAFRLILPEYYMVSCLACHGKPKGEIDKTGGRKEGGDLNSLGGAISVVIYDR